MRDFVKSFSSMGLALALFGVKQIENVVTPRDRGQRRGPATKAMDAVTNATVDQFDETLYSTFRMMDNLQRGLIGLSFSLVLPFVSSPSTSGTESRTDTWRTVPADSEPRANRGVRTREYYPRHREASGVQVLEPLGREA
jgi:hypothetical protein